MDRNHGDAQSLPTPSVGDPPPLPEIDPDTWLTRRTSSRLDRMADNWFKAQAVAVDLRDCTHEPPCRVQLAHYERERGVMVYSGPAADRIEYNETSGGAMTDSDIAEARHREATAAPERHYQRRQYARPGPNTKRRRLRQRRKAA